jgi:hypothetical protein
VSLHVDWRQELPSFHARLRIETRIETDRDALRREPPVRPFDPNDREATLEFFRRKALVPYEPPSGLDPGPVIGFGYVNRDEHKIRAERQAHAERRRLQAARREHERRLAEPWSSGEWLDDTF